MEQQVTSLARQVETAVSTALSRVRPELDGADPLVRRSDRADFQSNVALASAKRVKARPAELAAELAQALRRRRRDRRRGGLRPRLPQHHRRRRGRCGGRLGRRLADDRLGVERPEQGSRVVIDYSAPNIAKEMHVGHLRTTIIGDSLARVLGHLGADRDPAEPPRRLGHPVRDADPVPRRAPRRAVAPLRPRPARSTRRVDGLGARRAVPASPAPSSTPTRRSPTGRGPGSSRCRPATRRRSRAGGRSSTSPSSRSARSTAGSACCWSRATPRASRSTTSGWPRWSTSCSPRASRRTATARSSSSREDVKAPDGQPAVLMVQKRDGGYGYDTTDLATLRYRVRDLKADRILYVVDARQALHFRLIFEAARRMGWLTDGVEAVHVAFGTVLGAGRAAVQDPRRRHRAADAPDRRGRRLGAAHRRRARARPAAPPSSTGSPSRRASARSSTPTCRPPGSRTTRSTSRGWCR